MRMHNVQLQALHFHAIRICLRRGSHAMSKIPPWQKHKYRDNIKQDGRPLNRYQQHVLQQWRSAYCPFPPRVDPIFGAKCTTDQLDTKWVNGNKRSLAEGGAPLNGIKDSTTCNGVCMQNEHMESHHNIARKHAIHILAVRLTQQKLHGRLVIQILQHGANERVETSC